MKQHRGVWNRELSRLKHALRKAEVCASQGGGLLIQMKLFPCRYLFAEMNEW